MESKKFMMPEKPLTMVYICSPYRVRNAEKGTDAYKAELDKNISLAKAACRFAALEHYAPVAPHIFFTQFLEDETPEERELGMLLGAELLAKCDELWIVGNRITEGMQREIEQAKASDIRIKHCAVFESTQKEECDDLMVDDSEVVILLKEILEVLNAKKEN